MEKSSPDKSIRKVTKMGFLGGGNMAYAIVTGLIKYGKVEPSSIIVSTRTSSSGEKFIQLGCLTTTKNADLVKEVKGSGSDGAIFLCVKPAQFIESRSNFRALLSCFDGHIVSVMAGITLEALEDVLGKGLNVVRTIPNTAVQVGAGVWACTVRNNYSGFEKLQNLLSTISFFPVVEEKLIDIISGLSGSGIAFVYTAIQALSDGAVKMGLDRTLATQIAAATVIGAGKTVKETETHPYVLRDKVCSAGGTTIYGIHALDKAGFSGIIVDAVEASTLRCKVIAQGKQEKK